MESFSVKTPFLPKTLLFLPAGDVGGEIKLQASLFLVLYTPGSCSYFYICKFNHEDYSLIPIFDQLYPLHREGYVRVRRR